MNVNSMRTFIIRLVFTGMLITALSSDVLPAEESESESVADLYSREIKPLLRTKCLACHGPLKQESGLRLDTAAAARQGSESNPIFGERQFTGSVIAERLKAEDAADRMPPEGEPLTPVQISLLQRWIEGGALGPVDEKPAENPLEHWAFRPVRRHTAPSPPAESGNPIDAFIMSRLRQHQLALSQPAAPEEFVRRAFLDMHGLPPTPTQMQEWSARLSGPQTNSETLSAKQEFATFLLSSPRYGERWAQHWLDVVRYADTHGFEVNTPRPNAWHYRDYVIRAFNDDTPYDQFVIQQISGDSVGEDAATGFLVAAPVLLPGQIGKDDASKRLARQDSLDEIIIGTTATIMGLTVGCARCHDHKFDPISQRDYYAFQAFFAGVDYGDRQIADPDRNVRLLESKKLEQEIAAMKSKLRDFEPHAHSGRTLLIDDEDSARTTHLVTKNGHGTNPAGTDRGYQGDVGDASTLPNLSGSRYTWWNNIAGEDVFTWNPQTAGRFRLWVSWGTHGSGVHTRDARYVLDHDGDLSTVEDQLEIARADQYYFAGVDAGETEKKPMWSGFTDAGVHELTDAARLILRGGDTGTGITADVLLLQEETPSAVKEHLPRLRGPVTALHNIERFPPIDAKFVRFTTLETIDDNKHQPCLDELEVYRVNGSRSRDNDENKETAANIALSSAGTIATSSGNSAETGIHQLKHVHDGRYGNSWSWISNQHGGGWVQLEFPSIHKIDRIEWARDREGKFTDRLATRYRIDVSVDGKTWQSVAGHSDRQAMGTPFEYGASIARAGFAGREAEINQLTAQLAKLSSHQGELERPKMAYAGKFRQPDATRLLNRGDPEQPLEELSPQVPAIFGELPIDATADDSTRRQALARWLTSTDHPLTARVMVNRIWQGHFGRGLVETPSDFGLNGVAPSHPQLLDWLASEFVRSGWSVKAMHRLILTSDAYAQSNQVDERAVVLDADNRLLWRFAPRRLEGEAIRDSILYVSGRLNFKSGGPGFDFFKTRGGLSGFPPVENFTPENTRRMIYSHKIRMEPVPVFGAFDCPDAGQPMPKRTQSTTPIQALNLLNSPFIIEQSEAFAARIERSPGSLEAHVASAFHHCLGRPPDEFESQLAAETVQEHGLSALCRALFNSNEFLFLP
jgi:hypothetical protein